jgi:hypothetical protein
VQLHSVYRLHVRRYNSCTKLCKSENLTWLSRGASLCTICYFCTRQTVTYMPRNVTRPARNPDRSHAYALQPDEHMHHAHQSLSGRVLQRAGVAHSITHAWLEFESRRPVARRDAGPRPAPPRSSQPRIFPSRAARSNPKPRARLLADAFVSGGWSASHLACTWWCCARASASTDGTGHRARGRRQR